MGKEIIYRVRDCSYVVNGETILEPISFDVFSGDFLTIVGPSGVGKSTLLQILLGFIKPTTGSLEFFGEEITDKNYKILRDKSSVVFQEPVFFEDSVRDIICSPFKFRANSKREKDFEFLDKLFELFSLSNIDKEKGLDLLSGGEKQLISIIQAIMQKKDILILDEVTSALDSKSTEKVYNLLKEQHSTVICVSHSPEWIEKSDRVLELSSKRKEDI